MQTIKVSVQSRTQGGKGAVRRLRATGSIPAVAYGPKLPSTAIAVSPKDIMQILGTEYGRNTVIELDIDGSKKLTVLLTDFQYHPVTRALLHADFFEIKLDEPIDVEVPFETTGKAKGVIEGGVLRQVYRKLPGSLLAVPGPRQDHHRRDRARPRRFDRDESTRACRKASLFGFRRNRRSSTWRS